MKIFRFDFGTFEIEELKKFLRMGLIFALIIGIYWTLRPLKDSIFIQLTNISHIPYAKFLSTLSLFPLVIIYTKLLEWTSREKVLMILSAFYGGMILCFGILITFAQNSANSYILGYLWYLFVTSFGYFFVALFWAFSTDITEPDSAKKGFPLIVAIGQLGGIFCPYSIGGLPHHLHLSTDMLSILILGVLTLSFIPLIRSFLRSTPASLLVSFHGKSQQINTSEQSPGFLEGLKSLFSHRYLIGIFFVHLINETLVTIFDFNFKIAAAAQYTGVALSHYFSIHGSTVNVTTLACLLLGISNITRFLGVSIALAVTPIIMGLFLVGFLTIDSLSFLFALMVAAKAVDYSLNSPTLKQLYIPTTTTVRFKSQAWIETFGPAASPGPFCNMLFAPLGKAHYLIFISIFGGTLLLLWFAIALYLGRTCDKAVKSKEIIC